MLLDFQCKGFGQVQVQGACMVFCAPRPGVMTLPIPPSETHDLRCERQSEPGEIALRGVREFGNKSAASAASPDYAKFEAAIKSAASAASLRGGCASGRLGHGLFFRTFWLR